MEKVVWTQIWYYLQAHPLILQVQSACRAFPGKTVIKVTTDILCPRQWWCFCLYSTCLQYSPPSPCLPLQRLDTLYCMSSTTLSGFESRRTDRTQTAPTDYQRPNPIPFSFGIPQDSVLGPSLFVLLKFEWHKANPYLKRKNLLSLIRPPEYSNREANIPVALGLSCTPWQTSESTEIRWFSKQRYATMSFFWVSVVVFSTNSFLLFFPCRNYPA